MFVRGQCDCRECGAVFCEICDDRLHPPLGRQLTRKVMPYVRIDVKVVMPQRKPVHIICTDELSVNDDLADGLRRIVSQAA
jgi:hypothetical protein